MPKLVQLTSTVNTTPDSNHVILFYAEEDGVLKLKAKKSDGSVVDMLHELADISNSDENMSINWNFKVVNILDEALSLARWVELPEGFDDIMVFDANEEVICYYYPELPDTITIRDEELVLNEYFGSDASGSEGWLGYGYHRAFLITRGVAIPLEDENSQVIDGFYLVPYYLHVYPVAINECFDMVQTDTRTGLDIENTDKQYILSQYAEVTAIPIDE